MRRVLLFSQLQHAKSQTRKLRPVLSCKRNVICHGSASSLRRSSSPCSPTKLTIQTRKTHLDIRAAPFFHHNHQAKRLSRHPAVVLALWPLASGPCLWNGHRDGEARGARHAASRCQLKSRIQSTGSLVGALLVPRAGLDFDIVDYTSKRSTRALQRNDPPGLIGIGMDPSSINTPAAQLLSAILDRKSISGALSGGIEA